MATTLGYTRQYYYKIKKESSRKIATKELVINAAKQTRKLLPRLGGRKLHHMIKAEIESKEIKCGRDKLFDFLREENMLIRPKRRYIQTTDSKHWLRKYPNKIRDIEVKHPNQIWVSDITYIKTEEGNCYLNLITDKYSRAIVGYAIDDNMEANNMIKAYQMAINFKHNDIHTIHHSDRGLQYCSKDYVQLANKNNIVISMTENGDPYENALAERMNRTLKEEFGLGEIIKDRKTALKLTEEAVFLYNHVRPHNALNLNTPISIHLPKTKIPTNILLLQG